MKETVHPNAHLKYTRNMHSGLRTKSKILSNLDCGSSDASKIAKEAALSYAVVLHHLRLLENEGILERRGHRPYFWVPSGLGQKRLA